MSETLEAPAVVALVPETSPPVVIAPAVASPAEAQAATTTLLGGEAPKEPTAVEPDAAPAEPDAPEAQSVDPAPPLTYEPFTLPEGATVLPERLNEFTSLLGKHGAPQELGQQLVEFHVSEVKRLGEQWAESANQALAARATSWADEFKSDPEFGGNRAETSLNAAAEFIRTHGGSDEQQQAFKTMLNETKLGNHPLLIGLLARANTARGEGRPLAAQTPPSAPKSNIQKMYGGNTR